MLWRGRGWSYSSTSFKCVCVYIYDLMTLGGPEALMPLWISFSIEKKDILQLVILQLCLYKDENNPG